MFVYSWDSNEEPGIFLFFSSAGLEFVILLVLSFSANERQVMAILKLISSIARTFPGVFYHGKASAILPAVGRMLLFFTEPTFW